VAAVRIEFRDLSVHFEMLRNMAGKYKQKSRQWTSIDRADQGNPRKVPLTEAKKAKALREFQRAC
jgi:hypothetical protein